MIAFDTDVLTGILRNRADFVGRAATIAARDQAVPIIVVEEILRGRLNVIRRAESGKAKVGIERAYELFENRPWARRGRRDGGDASLLMRG